MAWVRIDDLLPDHRKVLEAGAEAAWLWVCGLCYCNRQKNRDGFIPTVKVAVLFPMRNALKLAERLVDVGMWEHAEGGYRIHDYHEYQPTLEEVADRRTKRAAAGRVGGKKSGESRRSNGEANAKQVASGLLPPSKQHDEANANPAPDPVLTPLPPEGEPVVLKQPEFPTRRRGDGLNGWESGVWARGIRRSTRQPCAQPSWTDGAKIQALIAQHGLTGEAAERWLEDAAFAFAETVDGTFGGFTVTRWLAWESAGRPGFDAPSGVHAVVSRVPDPEVPDEERRAAASAAMALLGAASRSA